MTELINIVISWWLAELSAKLMVVVAARNAVRLAARHLSPKKPNNKMHSFDPTMLAEKERDDPVVVNKYISDLRNALVKHRSDLHNSLDQQYTNDEGCGHESSSATIGLVFIDASLSINEVFHAELDEIVTLDDQQQQQYTMVKKKLCAKLFQQCDEVRSNLKDRGIKIEDT